MGRNRFQRHKSHVGGIVFDVKTSVFIKRRCIRRLSRFRTQVSPKTGFNVTNPTLEASFSTLKRPFSPNERVSGYFPVFGPQVCQKPVPSFSTLKRRFFTSRACIQGLSRFRSRGWPKTGFNATSPRRKTGFSQPNRPPPVDMYIFRMT